MDLQGRILVDDSVVAVVPGSVLYLASQSSRAHFWESNSCSAVTRLSSSSET